MSNLSYCGFQQWTEQLFDATYRMAAPLYFVIGLVGHGLLSWALYVQSKTQPAYLYQVYLAFFKTLQVFTSSLYYLSLYSVYIAPPLRALVFKNYGFMWFAAHLATQLSYAVITTSLLLSVAMACDRILALNKPLVYQNLNHKRHQAVALFFSILLSFSASIFDCFRSNVVEITAKGIKYFMPQQNTDFINSTSATVLAGCRIFLQAASLIALFVLSAVLCYLYRTRYVKPKARMFEAAEVANERKKEKTLMMMTILECVLNTIGMSFLMTNYIIKYGFPDFYTCISQPLTSLLDITIMIVSVADFYLVLVISKKFRSMLKASLSCCK